ncbi:MAG: FAD-dependent monooxygenase, partial [Gaiellaceae bacterium]
RAGMEATIFERAPKLIDVGCVQLWTNGMVALAQLDLADEALSRGWAMHMQEFRSWRGKVLIQAPVGELAEQHGTLPPVNIRRLDLIELVYEALEPGVVQFESAVTGFEQDESGVTVHLADGREERGSILIAADGTDSATRKTLVGGPPPRYAGAQVMRALIPFEHPTIPPGKFSLTFGKGDRFGMIHTSRDVLCWFTIIITPPGSTDPPGGRKSELYARFGDFPEPTKAVIDATPEETIYRADIRDILPLDRWGEGRVTLLGDAAHATTPYLGRGAGEAVEDAITLASNLASVGSLGDREAVSALRAYEAKRMPPTKKTQVTAWRFGQIAKWKNPVLFAVRERMMGTVGRRAVHKAIHAEFGELGKITARTDRQAEAIRSQEPA